MDAEVRRRIEMAERARDFSRANPIQDPTSATVVTRLEELVTRANALANQESAGRIARHAATVRRADLRRALVSHFLRPVVRAVSPKPPAGIRCCLLGWAVDRTSITGNRRAANAAGGLGVANS